MYCIFGKCKRKSGIGYGGRCGNNHCAPNCDYHCPYTKGLEPEEGETGPVYIPNKERYQLKWPALGGQEKCHNWRCTKYGYTTFGNPHGHIELGTHNNTDSKRWCLSNYSSDGWCIKNEPGFKDKCYNDAHCKKNGKNHLWCHWNICKKRKRLCFGVCWWHYYTD